MSLLFIVQAASIIGVWRGTSTCVDKVNFPACNDEVVIYTVKAHPSARDSVIVSADKVVNNQREPMGDITFGRRNDSTWVAEVKVRLGTIRFNANLRGDRWDGELRDVAKNIRVRDIQLRKDK